MKVQTAVVQRVNLERVWPKLEPGVREYIRKTPHETGDIEEIKWFLRAEDGDEVLVITADGEYAGFITFKVQWLDGELWGTMAMVFLEKRFQGSDVLKQAADQLRGILRLRGCTVMNYFTARKGFRRLAPALGFRPRIIEWMREVD